MTTRIRSFRRGSLVFDVTDGGPLEGEIVILLHGFPQTAKSWDAVAALLQARGYRTLAFDQRGYAPGARPRGRWAYRLRELVDDVVALVREAGAPVHLVGHDWGAAVAWTLAAEFPELLRTLTAVSVPHPLAFLRSMLSSTQALRSWYIAVNQVPALSELCFRYLPGRVRWFLYRTGMTEEQAQTMQTDVVDSGALTGGLNWYRAIPFTNPFGLKKVQVPTTYVWSAGDIALSRRGARLCEKYVSGPYELKVLEGSHWIPEEQPERLTEIIVERIRSDDAAAQ